MAVFIAARHMVGGYQHEHIARVKWENTTDSNDVGENSRQEMVDWIRDRTAVHMFVTIPDRSR